MTPDALFDRLAEYDVTWDSPSADIAGTMPAGNGDIGVNAWVEPAGDLLLLIGKTDAWDHNSINLKIGRIRITLEPNPFAGGSDFRQTLVLRRGDILIDFSGVRLKLWIDANAPVIRVEFVADTPVAVRAAVELWRNEPRTIKTQTSDIFKNLVGKNSDPYPTVITPDHIFTPMADEIAWCHHNPRPADDGFDINMRLQGMGGWIDQMKHPLAGRTFGGLMRGEGFRSDSATSLVSDRSTSHLLSIFVHATRETEHAGQALPAWRDAIGARAAEINSVDLPAARRAHEAWWESFWSRSWIFITAPTAADQHSAFDVTRGYVLSRFLNAAGGRGASPIKHNGSIFSVGRENDPDFRRWGGPGFWFMNQRLVYWPMLASGDFDLIRPWLQMYIDCLPLQRHRTRAYFGHGGAHYPETIMFWGAEVSAHYGWTPFEQRATPEAECAYLRYYWSGGIELSLFLLEYFIYTGDENFARDALFPIADAVTEFYDHHFPRDTGGKIRFEPAQALETWHSAVNPTPEIAGLLYLANRLLALRSLPRPLHERCDRMLRDLPPLPTDQSAQRRIILPAEQFDLKKNSENPELYCIFPYRIFGVGKPDLQLARDTFAFRQHRDKVCWSQDDIQMALLGQAEKAKTWLAERASDASHSDSRFPAFWNAFHDWVPDIDHGGVLQLALQFMLLQCEDETTTFLPAWPAGWDAEFKLHAPNQQIIAGSVRAGVVLTNQT